MQTKTSTTDPIRVDFLPAETMRLPGRVGMTFAHGKNSAGIECRCARDLETDLVRLRNVYETEVTDLATPPESARGPGERRVPP